MPACAPLWQPAFSAADGWSMWPVARLIHRLSRRKSGRFVALNCAAFPETLLESELFGHARGAFTGAVGARPGKFETATGDTLLLNEVGEMPLALQPKLLRALQEREFDRLGSNQTVRVDIRVISTSNRPLEAAVAEGRFRADSIARKILHRETQIDPHALAGIVRFTLEKLDTGTDHFR
jgi:DNA-binding NtrC family response regulator